MTTLELIQKRVNEGYDFECGQHLPLGKATGYWASFVPLDDGSGDRCEECDQRADLAWEEAGHGSTICEAVRMADRVAFEGYVVDQTPADFGG